MSVIRTGSIRNITRSTAVAALLSTAINVSLPVAPARADVLGGVLGGGLIGGIIGNEVPNGIRTAEISTAIGIFSYCRRCYRQNPQKYK